MRLSPTILQVVIDAPLRQVFDYLLPSELAIPTLEVGARVIVPFLKKEKIGIIVKITSESDFPLKKLRAVREILDEQTLFPPDIWQMCLWSADYYHHPLGEVLFHAIPTLLRQGKKPLISTEKIYHLSEAGNALALNGMRAKKLVELIQLLKNHPTGVTGKFLKENNISQAVLKKAIQKNGITITQQLNLTKEVTHPPLFLNDAQATALETIKAKFDSFQVFLLDGVTGSGKTEVYLQTIKAVIESNKQVLILVPEIGLTPQTIQRFRERFSEPVIALHSGLSNKERLNAWMLAKTNHAKIIIGTRSAIFTPFENLGLIIVDEEHDTSFKQQDGFRYHARDLAVKRAHDNKITIILGSATPSLETLNNIHKKHYQHLILPYRAGMAIQPNYEIIDIRNQKLEEGLSSAVIQEIKIHLAAGNQVMLFLNRRGFAPVILCHGCGWIMQCHRCEARMTFHHKPFIMHCHHCDFKTLVPKACAQCQSLDVQSIGLGTERLEKALQHFFPEVSIARVDRDNANNKIRMEELLHDIHALKHQILIGTQMLAKGHHFPKVTLVAIIDGDGGFFSSDFRALERMGQLLLQVAGRAGRVDRQGKVMIQTHHPDHPLLYQLTRESYFHFAKSLLKEREHAILPPFVYFALFRAEAFSFERAHDFLNKIKKYATQLSHDIKILGPIPSPMSRRAGHYRVQLLLQSNVRTKLQDFLKSLLVKIESQKDRKQIRWSLDVDPIELF